LSPRLLWREVERYESSRVANKSTYWLKHELIWRDFLRFGGVAWGNDIFKMHGIGGQVPSGVTWSREQSRVDDWVAGRTGFPFVDCFMREVAATGYTTHCGRECVAWFAVRDLRLDWRIAAEYFEHILIDYEPTANWGNWAYRIAPTVGRPSDAVQTTEMLLWAQQHDPCARHVKLWIPELAPLPAAVALEPWRLLIKEVRDYFRCFILP
jgi:deoxyribodipyrimidine photo-lyase